MNISKLTTPFIALAMAFSTAAYAQESFQGFNLELTPKREIRAVWLTTLSNLDWPKTHATSPETIEAQKRELTETLDQYARANINTVLLQTRVRSATIYPSDIEPWDICLTGREGKSPGYDPLQFAIEECHKRGMELHAWIATIPCGAWNSLGCRRLRSKGFRIKRMSSGAYLDPSDEKVAPYLASICEEITRKYDVDGINLDYIRYPDGWPRPSYRYGDTPDNRRANIDRIVKAIHEAVASQKPWVKVSCSPIGKYSDLSRYSSKNYNARDRVFQDAQMWLRMGWMEQLYPMQYFRGDNYYPFTADWMENSHGNALASGLGTWFLDPRYGKWSIHDIAREMEVSRLLGMGHAHFRSQFLTENHQGIYDFEVAFNSALALVPPVKGKCDAHLQTPTQLQVSEDAISWQGNAPFYNVYVSDVLPVDISNPQNLLLARYQHTTLSPKLQPNLFRSWPYIAITAMDRYGNESSALQMEQAKTVCVEHNLPANIYLPNDGNELDISKAIGCLLPMDIDYYAISSLQGVRIRSYLQALSGTDGSLRLFVGGMEDGVYWVYAHNKRTRKMARVGAFEINRKAIAYTASM